MALNAADRYRKFLLTPNKSQVMAPYTFSNSVQASIGFLFDESKRKVVKNPPWLKKITWRRLSSKSLKRHGGSLV